MLAGAPGGDPIKENQSMLNPADAATMAQSGDMQANMTVRDFLQQLGIDVDGPVDQLKEFAQKQVSNAGGMSKMQNIAQSAGPAGPPAPGAGQPVQPDMKGLLGSLG